MKPNERVLEVVTRIMVRLADTKIPGEASDEFFDELTARGYSSGEISEAMTIINAAIAKLSRSDDDAEIDSRGKIRHRPLTREEQLRMSEEAIDVFRSWRERAVVSPEEAEDILRDFSMYGPGDVDKDDLIRLAQSAARKGSTLDLYLSESARKH